MKTEFSIGPKTHAWLSAAFATDLIARAESEEQFLSLAIDRLGGEPMAEVEALVDIVDEMVSMDLPILALKMIDHHPSVWDRGDFRGSLAEGIAAMLLGENSRAEMALLHAQKANPKEPAPYLNLVQLYIADSEFSEAKVWALAGLEAEPNNLGLWELFAYLEKDSPENIEGLAKKLRSWAGSLCHTSRIPGVSAQSLLGAMGPFLAAGERSPEFLVEYTGLLGSAGDFEAIAPLILQAEALGEPLPWKLKIHLIQSYAASENWAAFFATMQKLLADPSVPDRVKRDLENLAKELAEEGTHDHHHHHHDHHHGSCSHSHEGTNSCGH